MPRSDATPCPTDLSLEAAETLLREAVRRGWVSASMDGVFPRHAWIRDGSAVFEGRLTNSGLGQYKSYPIASDEAPRWLP